MKVSNMELKELENKIKEVKKEINKIDILLYGSDFEMKVALMKKREANRYVNGLTDKRCELIRLRASLESEYRRKRLSHLGNFNTGILEFGAFTDVHTPKFKGSTRSHFSAIRGITL